MRVLPRARRSELAGMRAGVARSRVSVVRGASARDKVVRVEGVDAGALRSALELAPGDDPFL